MPTAKLKKSSTSTKSKMSTAKAPTGFIKATRVFLKGSAKPGTKEAKTAKVGKQTNFVQVSQISAVRARRIVKGANATIVINDGQLIDVAENLTELSKAISAVYAD